MPSTLFFDTNNNTSQQNNITKVVDSPNIKITNSIGIHQLHISDGPKDRILWFNDFQSRDLILSSFDSARILYVFSSVPAFSIKSIDSYEISRTNLKYVIDSQPFYHENAVILRDKVSQGITLGETSSIIGVQQIRDQYGLTGAGIEIAIIDSGVDSDSPSFDTRVITEVVTALEDKGAEDEDGHGTHVSSISSGNGLYQLDGEIVQTDSMGMAPESTIRSIRVLDENGYGENIWVIEGIDRAINSPANIISLSLSTAIYEGSEDPHNDIIDAALNNGKIVISAAGNTGPIGSGIGIPSAIGGVISVGASYHGNGVDETWTYTGIGPKTNGYPGPDIVAPGAQIISVELETSKPTILSGTSMATPHVSGGVALLLEQYPEANVLQIRESLLSSATLLYSSDNPIAIEAQGRGLVNFVKAYDILGKLIQESDKNQISMNPRIIQDNNYIYRNQLSGITKNLPIFTVTSNNMTIYPMVDADVTHGVEFTIPTSVALTTLNHGLNTFTIGIHVTSTHVEENYGKIYFTDEFGVTLPNANISYTSVTRYKKADILFDISKDNESQADVSYFGNHGPYGQFSVLSRTLENDGHLISINENEITSALLSDFNVLIIANPDSSYSASELDAINNFSQNQGGAILLIVNGGFLELEGNPVYSSFNKETINGILEGTGIQITTASESIWACDHDAVSYADKPYDCASIASMDQNQDIFHPDTQFLNFGPELSVDEDDNTQVVARVNNLPVLASHETPTNGRVLVFSSSLLFDNIGQLLGYNIENENWFDREIENQELAMRSIEWLVEPHSTGVTHLINGADYGHNLNMILYEDYQITFVPLDNQKVQFDMGDSIEVDIVFEDSYYDVKIDYSIITVNKNDDGGYTFNYQFEKAGTYDFYLRISKDGLITSDGHLKIHITLNYFDDQSTVKKITGFILIALFISWILWLRNEGGKLKRENEIKIN